MRPPLVGLAQVYAIDMGRRTADRDLWAEVCWGVPTGKQGPAVLEIGCGQWRVPLLLAGEEPAPTIWAAIDVDPDMFVRPHPPWCVPCPGDALDDATWTAIEPDHFDAAIVPYSTLFLFAHHRQEELLSRCARAVRSGGLVVVECFVSVPQPGPVFERFDRVENPDGGEPWIRATTYRVADNEQVTKATRSYGPNGNGAGCRFVVEETIYWCHPEQLHALAGAAGLQDVLLLDGTHPTVPAGHVVVLGRVP